MAVSLIDLNILFDHCEKLDDDHVSKPTRTA